jgi:D-alanyl-lipoteichoic acid acyltransferase DltB (MBOAT superfamily)
MFFPQLVAGPIERPQNLLPQFYEKHYFDYQRIVDGLKLMAWGMFKKVVIADRLAILVNNVYDHPTKYQGIPLFVATLFFTFQIYCDFSGYTDIARGAARILGFRLMLNFRQPYLSQSVSEFWKRWHISLSTWFRDYVYIPLGGNRVKTARLYANLLLTFTISGLWHGANWTFVFWGMLNGFYLILPLAFSNASHFIPWKVKIFKSSGAQENNSISPLLKTLFTFILIFFSWILFRAHSLADVSYIITNMFRINFQLGGFNMGLTHFELLFSIFLICLLIVSDYLIEKGIVSMKFPTYPKWIRWSFYYALIFGILIFGVFEKTQFIYFQF